MTDEKLVNRSKIRNTESPARKRILIEKAKTRVFDLYEIYGDVGTGYIRTGVL
jgi:hypothetical protein